MKNIGLLGFKQVGKSEAAKYLESKGWVRHNMKDALIKELKENFPDTLEAIGSYYGCTIDELFDRKPKIMRALMQNYGTEVRRKDDPEYWTQKWSNGAAKLNADGKHVVADDIRFRNEAERIKASGGILIRIERDDITSGGSHPSETEGLHIKADYTIKTVKGDLEGLYLNIVAILLIVRG